MTMSATITSASVNLGRTRFKVCGLLVAALACSEPPPAAPEPRFPAGDCIVAKDGYIWKITRVQDGRYYSMGWQRNAWGNETSFAVGHFEDLGYKLINCPERR